MCTLGGRLTRPGDNLGWSLRRPSGSHTSGSNRASQDLRRRSPYGGQRHKSWLASCMPSLGCPGNSRCALASTGASQVANWFVGVIILGGPSGDLQLVTLVALIALARTYAVDLRM